MAVHDLGYRGLSQSLSGVSHRWVVVASTGIRRAWQTHWLRRMVLFAWLPACVWSLGFFFWEQSLLYPGMASPLEPVVANAPRELREVALQGRYVSDRPAARHAMWTFLLQSFFRKPQAIVMVIVVGLIAPPLISQDIRSRAFLLYFSRPLSRAEYILGKLTTIWFYLALISTIPALALYLLGILLSPKFGVVTATWDLPLRVLGATAVLAIPTAALALCLSSLTQESRYAGFAWFAIWILGWVTYGIMTAVDIANSVQPLAGHAGRWSIFSLYHTLGRVQNWVFGSADFQEVRFSIMILSVITVASLILLFRRVAAPMRM